jgi:hypothetical protein
LGGFLEERFEVTQMFKISPVGAWSKTSKLHVFQHFVMPFGHKKTTPLDFLQLWSCNIDLKEWM